MKKMLFFVFLIMLLAACGGGTAELPTSEPQAPAANPTADEATDTAETEAEPVAVEPQPETDASFPAANVAGAAVVREQDWVKGAEEPIITIIEYGDFQ
ncbi:MAG TPA: hypothetical protein EYP41_10485 [Anaerolineae bacterium]|nr:hypothetical protein [Anaerolineae bacterium]